MSFDTTDLNAVKAFVGQALGIPMNLWTYWEIIDRYPADKPELALAHYTEDYDPYNRSHEPLRKIRGTVVDLTTGAVVADSYGYTQTLPVYGPLREFTSPDNPSGSIILQTEVPLYFNRVEDAPEEAVKLRMGDREFDQSTTRLSIGYEGVLVRIFKWKDQVFFSTHRRIDALRSGWGGRKPFYELYTKLGGPDLKSIFGEEPYSPYCHQFLVVDNEIRLATSTRDNRILYLGVKKVWNEEIYATESGPYAWSDEFVLYVPQKGEKSEPEVFSQEIDRAMFIQSSISVATANKFLFPQYYAPRIPASGEAAGYNAKENELIIDYTDDGEVREVYFNPVSEQISDERVIGGDFVIMYTQTPDGETIVYRLEPTAFEYRVMVTGNDPNMYHRFVTEMIHFTKGDPHDLLSKYPRYIDSSGQLHLDEPVERRIYWWSLFYGAVAPAFKEEVDGYLQRYNDDIKKVADFIVSDFPKIKDEEELKRINQNTRNRFTELRQIASDISRREKRRPHTVLVNLLYKETGPSLYKMMSTVRNILRFRASARE